MYCNPLNVFSSLKLTFQALSKKGDEISQSGVNLSRVLGVSVTLLPRTDLSTSNNLRDHRFKVL